MCDVARVWIGDVSRTTLEEYLSSGEWRGKAGGYNLLDRLAAGWPIRVIGDTTTVMGLPMVQLNRQLQPESLRVLRDKKVHKG